MEINLKCPKCGQTELFEARNFASVNILVDRRGDVIDANEVNPEWDGEDLCSCIKCGFSGSLGEFNIEMNPGEN